MPLLRPAAVALLALAASGCVQATIAWTDLSPRGPVAAPALAYDSVDRWEAQGAPAAREALQHYVYGYFPDASQSAIIDRRVVNSEAFGGRGIVEEYRVAASATFGGETAAVADGAGKPGFIMNVVIPKSASGPAPVIMMETFCPRWDTMPDPGVSGAPPADAKSGGMMESVGTFVFGRYICTPPVEAILDAGYAIATIFPSEIVPDRDAEGLAALKRLSAGHADDETRWGAIAAWAWGFSRMVDVLEQDARLDRDAMIAWGHSRYAKAALLAAAFDPRIDGVIAHQSGTGGASLNFRKKGEGVASITKSYPHWFSRTYAAYTDEAPPPVDQHALIALIAPRPVLLGNARRDVWSDPNGAFRASVGADPIYHLYGARGLDQMRLKPYDPAAGIAFWIRPGTHGVVKEDWPAFLAFLDAHFGAKDEDRGGGVVSSGKD
ncbi:MAG: alpha/beta hydrolase [Parvularculaceae bacterium]